MGTITNEQIFQLLQKTSQDVLDIKQDVTSYKEEVEVLKTTVEFLEAENYKLKEKVSHQELLLRRKNILIFGLHEIDARSLEETVLDFFRNKLQITLSSGDLDNYYRIGEKSSTKIRPILVKFFRELTAQEILKNARKLKGTGQSIARDLTEEQRAQSKILYDFLKIAKEKQFPAKVVKSKLIIGNDEYSVDTLENLDKRTFLEPIVDKGHLFPNTSAPSTPTTAIEDKEIEGDNEVFIEQENKITQEEHKKNTKTDINQKTKSKDSKNQDLSSSNQTPRTTRSTSTVGQKLITRRK